MQTPCRRNPGLLQLDLASEIQLYFPTAIKLGLLSKLCQTVVFFPFFPERHELVLNVDTEIITVEPS